MRVGAARVAGMVAAAWGVRAVARAVGQSNDSGKRVGRAMHYRGARCVLRNAKKSVEGSE